MAKGITTVTQIDKAIRGAMKTGEHTALPITGFKGLELRIRPSGQNVTATFRHRYTHPYTEKRPYMTIGQYPAISLEQARTAHSANVALLAQSIDPMMHREQEYQAKIASMNNTVAAVAKSWLAHSIEIQKPKVSTLKTWTHGVKLVIKEWGNTPVKDVTTPMVLSFCKSIQVKHIDTGRRMRSMCDRIFGFAIVQGYMSVNPAKDISSYLSSAPVQNHDAIVSPVPFAKLLRDIDALPDNNDRTALQLVALLFTRVGDMCAMKWSDIDFDAAQWMLTPQKGVGRGDMVNELIIPLPKQAIAILERQREKTGAYEHVFHNHRKQKNLYMNSSRLSDTLRNMKNGYYKGKHVPHGFRASALTMLQEQLGYPNHLADAALGHAVKDINGAAYNRAKFIEQRRDMMAAWADYIDQLKVGNTIIRADFKAKAQKLG